MTTPRGVRGRSPGLIAAEALIETGQVELVIEQVIQRVLERAGPQLFAKDDGFSGRTTV
jgi:hypothetical protein